MDLSFPVSIQTTQSILQDFSCLCGQVAISLHLVARTFLGDELAAALPSPGSAWEAWDNRLGLHSPGAPYLA